MKAIDVVSNRDREILEYNGLAKFEALWSLECDWCEEPNYRRHGWSGVSRHLLKMPEGGFLAVFIKRQQNHNFKSPRHPFGGLPTAYREYINICRLKRYGLPCPELVFYGHRNTGGQWQAILVTRSLTGYRSLEESLGSIPPDDLAARTALLASVAETLSRIHRCYLLHGSLYPKHILVQDRNQDGLNHQEACRFRSVLIDLERMRRRFSLFWLALCDLDQLYRRWRRKEGDWEAFLGSYLDRMEFGVLSRRVKAALLGKNGSCGKDADCRFQGFPCQNEHDVLPAGGPEVQANGLTQ